MKKAYYEILKNFTKQKILNFKLDFFRLDQKLKKLEDERVKFVKKFNQSNKLLDSNEIRRFIELIKKMGTIPFSIYARHAFIAKKFLNSLNKENIISNRIYFKILNSVGTITNDYIELEKKSHQSTIQKKKFINFFYHLRPGTYNVCIDRNNKKISEYSINNLDNLLSFNTFIPKIEKIMKLIFKIFK